MHSILQFEKFKTRQMMDGVVADSRFSFRLSSRFVIANEIIVG